MYLKIHEQQGQKIIALCDSELLGKVYRSGKLVLDLDKYRAFYEGEKVSHDEAVSALWKANSANIVGKKAIEAAKAAGIVLGSEVVVIGGVPHCQAYRI